MAPIGTLLCVLATAFALHCKPAHLDCRARQSQYESYRAHVQFLSTGLVHLMILFVPHNGLVDATRHAPERICAVICAYASATFCGYHSTFLTTGQLKAVRRPLALQSKCNHSDSWSVAGTGNNSSVHPSIGSFRSLVNCPKGDNILPSI